MERCAFSLTRSRPNAIMPGLVPSISLSKLSQRLGGRISRPRPFRRGRLRHADLPGPCCGVQCAAPASGWRHETRGRAGYGRRREDVPLCATLCHFVCRNIPPYPAKKIDVRTRSAGPAPREARKAADAIATESRCPRPRSARTILLPRGTFQARATLVQAEVAEAIVEARDLAAADPDTLHHAPMAVRLAVLEASSAAYEHGRGVRSSSVPQSSGQVGTTHGYGGVKRRSPPLSRQKTVEMTE